jgi:hypothetical protein
LPSSSTTSTAMPSPALDLAAHRRLGRNAEHEAAADVGAAEIEARCTSGFTPRRRSRTLSGASGEPVDSMARTLRRSCVSGVPARLLAWRRCIWPRCRTCVRFSPARSPTARCRRDERRAVIEQQRAPARQPDASQFHIIQPSVVK